MYRIHNGAVVNAFKKAASAAADRSIGQLMRIDLAGNATTTLGQDNMLFYPVATEDFKFATDDNAALQMTGVADVYVEDYSDIDAGAPVSPGSTGVGIKRAEGGEFVLGFAIVKPVANGELISVALAPQPATGSIY